MKRPGKTNIGCLSLLVILLAVGVLAQISLYKYEKKQTDADVGHIESIVSDEMPDSLVCVDEISLGKGEISITVDQEHYRYNYKIPGEKIVVTINSRFPVLIYDSGTHASGESHYKETLDLEELNTETAKFLVTVVYDGAKDPVVKKNEFTISESYRRKR